MLLLILLVIAVGVATMVTIEEEIKSQYAKFFEASDWRPFKEMADYYLESAARLMIKHVKYIKNKRVARNIQKRLFIGVGCELLLKSLFLQRGHCINRPRKKFGILKPPFKIDEINRTDFYHQDTYTIDAMINMTSDVITFSDQSIFIRGMKIAKVFRNKEGHVAVYSHSFEDSNYTDIENALVQIYNEGFNEQLNLQFSVRSGEPAVFEVVPRR
jgi:hypothetical protein